MSLCDGTSVVRSPAILTVNAAPGQCASNVTFTVTATDNCSVTNLASAPASGSAFPAGTTKIGRASWRERGKISVGAVSLKKKKNTLQASTGPVAVSQL